MAIYRFSLSGIVSRGKGRRIMAAAAYQSGQKLVEIEGRPRESGAIAAATYQAGAELQDERSGTTHDYRRKRGVLHTEVLAPDNAPSWVADRARLWNEVEARENSSTRHATAQLARTGVISLPCELSLADNIALIRRFVEKEFVARGMVVDLAVHAPDRDGDLRNVHAHIMLTMREIGPDGFGLKRREWNDISWQRKKAGEISPLMHWRKAWAAEANAALESAGCAERMDHRSLRDQGIEREPEPKMGPVATEMERQGKASHVGDERRAAQERNRRRKEARAELAETAREIEQLKGAGSMPDDPVTAETRRQSQAAETETARQAQAVKDEQANLDKAGREWADRDSARRAALIEQQAERHRDRLVEHAAEIQQAREAEQQPANRFEEYRGDLNQQTERGKQATSPDTDIRNARTRYEIALGREFDMADPTFRSLARVAMVEHAMFKEQQEGLTQAIFGEQNPEARHKLELRREIEGLEYLAITGERIAVQSEIITGKRNSPEAVRMRARISGEQLTQEKAEKLFAGQRLEPEDITAFVAEVTKQQAQQGGGWAQQARALRAEYREPAAGMEPIVAARQPEPWMMQEGGFGALSDLHKASARRSYAEWTDKNPNKAETFPMGDYVIYAQSRERERAGAQNQSAVAPQRPAARPARFHPVDLSKVDPDRLKQIMATDDRKLSQEDRRIQRAENLRREQTAARTRDRGLER